MFSPLSVCLSVCEQNISKNYEQIQTKLGGQVGCVMRTKLFDIGEDPDPRIFEFLSDTSPLRDGAKNDTYTVSRYFKKLWTSYDKTR